MNKRISKRASDSMRLENLGGYIADLQLTLQEFDRQIIERGNHNTVEFLSEQKDKIEMLYGQLHSELDKVLLAEMTGMEPSE